MRILSRSAAVLLTASIVLGGTATAVTAQTTTIKDKASDVLTYADRNDPQDTQLGYADSVASGVDMRSLRVKHTKKSVVVRLTFADLGAETVPILNLRLDGQPLPSRFVVVSGDDRGSVLNTQGTKKCSAPMTVRLGAKGYVNVVIKRSCLGDPKRIKVSAVAGTDEGFLGETGPATVDVFSSAAVRSEGWTKWLKAS